MSFHDRNNQMKSTLHFNHMDSQSNWETRWLKICSGYT